MLLIVGTSAWAQCDSAPEIICPEDFVGCSTADITPGQMGFPHDFPSFPNVKDVMVCGTLVFDYNDAIISNGITCNEATVIERTWFAHYELNPADTITCIQTISLVDSDAPIFETCPEKIEVAEGEAITWTEPTVTDNCGFMVSASHNKESAFAIGCTTVTYTATDDCFNESTCTFEVCVTGVCNEIVDLSCPDNYVGCIGDIILPSSTGMPMTGSGTSSASCGDIILDFDDDIISQNDPCEGAIVFDRVWSASYTNNPEGVRNCIQSITITDTTAPILSACPANVNLAAGQNIATWEAPTASDNCGLTMTSTHNSGDAFPVGCTMVVYTAKDNCGNEVSCSFEVCVESACAAANAVPIITCPPEYSSCPGSSIDPTVTGNPTVTSTSIECGSIVTFYDSVAETYAGCAGGQRIERLWVAKYADNPADSAVCIQIIDLIDNTNPTIVCPNNITLPSTNNIAEWETPTFEDACGATLTANNTSGTAFPVGCTPVTYIATDNCGNSASCTFNVCVEEAPCSSIPIITCPADFVGCPGSSIDPADTGNPTVTTTSTECGTIVTFFDNVVEEYANCPGGRRIERTWSAEYSDNPGNPATCIQIIDLKDTEVPVVSCPENISLTGGDKIATWATPTFTDNCGAGLSGSHSSGATFSEGCTTVTYTATDNCGNTATCSFEVCVEAVDECITPLIVICPADYVGCPGDPISPNDIGVPTTENPISGCGDIRGYFEDKIVEVYDGCANSVRIERTWEVAYVGYREYSVFCTQIIDLKDQTSPTIQCPTSINLTGGNDVATWNEPTFSDNCGATLSGTHSSGSSFEAGCTTITYTATDNCGNASNCSFAICVEQAGCTGVPTILCPPSYFGCPNSSIDPAVCGIPTVVSSNPNCGTILGYVDSEKSLYPNCPGGFRIERLWTVFYEDNPNEVTTCLQIIDLNDDQAPEITSCPSNITLTGGANVATWTPASYSDNCGATLSGTHTSGSTFDVGCTPVTYTVTDNCGNAVSCTFEVCVEAACNSVPNLTCPPSYFGCPGSSIHPDVCGRPTVTNVDENCGRVLGYYDVTLEEYANCPGGKRIERTWEVFYENNPNETVTCTQIIDLNDSEAPTISCPDNISLAGGATVVTWDAATFTDNCGASLSSSHVSGSSFPIGCTTVTYTVEDNCGNSTACSFDVCIANTCDGVPTISCPADYVGCPGSSISSSVTGNATASSNNSSCGQIIITHSDQTVETYNCQGAKKIKRTWRAYYLDNSAEFVECEQFITLNDTTTPSINNCPGNINGFIGETITWAEPTFNDNCSYTVTQSHFSGTVFPEGCTTVTYTVTDDCGNAVSCDFIVCIQNACIAVPEISCPPDFIGCPGSSIDPSVTGNLNILSTNNNCGSIIICHEDEIIRNFACDGSMEIRREWKAVYSENEENPVYCYQTIKLEDRQNPSITNCPADITADEGTVINWTTPTFTDNCTYTVSSSHSSGNTFPLGCTTVTYTVTDGCGATATCSFNVCINAVCNEVPVLNCPADYSGCPGTSTDTSVTGQATATATTNDCGQIVVTHTDEIITAYNCTNANKIRRTWSAYYQDNASQVVTCEQIIDMNDNQAPTIANCPVDISANEGETIHWASPDFADNCSYAVSSTHNSGSTFPVGCTTVTYTVTDGCGATATCSFDVCITAVCDDIPSITCPADYVGCPGTSTNSSVTGQPTVSSNSTDCGQVITEFSDEVLETYSCNGGQRIRRTWKTYHADNSTSAATCTQIIDLRDTQAPSISNCPANITVDEGQVVTWNDPTFNDNCSFNVNVSHTSGTTFPTGCTTVTYTVTDPCGNTTTCSFEVCVNRGCDAVPSISCPSVFRGCAADTDDPAITGFPTTSGDATGCGDIVVNYSDMFTEDYSDDCAGSKKVVRMWYASYENNPISTSSCIQVIDLHDKQRPTVRNCPTNLTFTGGAQAVTWEDPITTDNCGSNDLVLTSTHTSGTVFSEGCTTVTYTSTDACGNNRDCSFEVCIEGITCDDTPSMTCLSDYSGCPGDSTDPSNTGTPTVSGGNAACGDFELDYSDEVVQTYAGCNNARRIIRTWKAQYENNDGHFVICMQEIDLRDQIDPVLNNCPANINLTGGNKVATWTAPTATDNCSTVNLSSTHSSGSSFSDGCTTVRYTATDNCGNSSTCSFTVCVENECNSIPVITCPADYTGCPGGSIDPSVTGNPTVTTTNTECGSIVTFYDEILEEYANCNGGKKIKRTWSASYSENSDNAATCEQIIDLRDTQSPTVSCPNNINLTGGNKVATWSTPSVTDNCGATLSSTHSSGATFADGCTTVTYTAADNCGNVTTCNFTVCVENECNSVPVITCPADYTGCPGGSIDPSVTGNPTVTTTNTNCGSIVTYYDEILEEYANCNGGKKIKRTWSASYSENSDNAATCEQIIDLRDTQSPTVSCPNNINLTGGNRVATWSIPSVTDNCGATLSSTHSSGATFADGCTTVTYTAADNCGNVTTCNFTVCVENECNSVPIITCPADYTGCPGGSIDPSVTGNPTVTTTNTDCGSIVTYYDEILEEYANCNGGKKIKRTWSASYSENSDNAATCEQIIDLRDTQNPSLTNCPANITLTGGENVATWSTPSVSDNCGATLGTTHSSGSIFEIGCTTVTYTATDNCSNTRTCSFQVCVEDGGLGNVGIECVDDMVIACGENGGATAHWDIPTVDASCNACTGNQIAGFIFMGTYNGHQYYCSKDPALWTNAQVACANNGGYLAVINTAAENAFLANLLTTQSAYIGCSDATSEGNFTWVNGDALNYTNWYPGQPNNYNNAQHHVELLSNGQWNDQYVHVPLEYIMEIPCASMVQTAGPAYGSQLSAGCYDIEYTYSDACNNFAKCSFEVCVEAALTLNCVKDVTVSCPNTDGGIIVNWEEPQVTTCCTNCGPNGSLQIDGFIYMGSFGGSNYYCSNDPSLWPNAKKTCQSYGGNLAVITSAEENEFLANILTIQSAYIGLSDADSQGNYTWCDGSALEYTNWYPGQPNNYNNNQDYCEMLSNGQWNDQYNTKPLEFIMEIPSCIDISKIQGPANGSYFPVGTTSISYEATDACGYKDNCTFNITVAKSGCVSGGQQSNNAWINKVQFANINNTSGNNGGYQDFTNVCGDISAGSSYPLKLTPGFPSNASTVYWKCYIDFNNDGDYTDSGEYIATGSGFQTLSGSITIPTNIWNGTTTMRVVMRLGGPPSGPCDVFTYGETEDYCINITGADFDSGEEAVVGRSRDSHDNVVRLIAEEYITVDLNEGANEEVAGNEGITNEAIEAEHTSELSNRFSISVFPNPASEKVNIHNLTRNKIKTIEIVNVSGQVVYSETGENFESRDKSINISNLPSGIYMIKVIDETGQRVSKKLSVQRF